jgi:alpha,alpha-trehalase
MPKDLPALHFDTAVFDLDGVITRTAKVHAVAWKRLFDDYLKMRERRDGEPFREFDIEDDYLRKVDGKPRYKGVKSFLDSRGIDIPFGDPSDGPDVETACGLGNRKQGFFVKSLQEQGVQVYQPSIDVLNELRDRGVHVGVATSSKNCRLVLEKARLSDAFEARVDGVVSAELGLSGKPEPDIFTKTVELMGMGVERAVVFEDAVSGVQAGRAGEFALVMGVDRGGIRSELWDVGADIVVTCLSQFGVEKMNQWFRDREHARPSALWRFPEIGDAIARGRPVLFLNRDAFGREDAGPEPSFDALHRRLAELAGSCPVYLVSVRDTGELPGELSAGGVAFTGDDGGAAVERLLSAADGGGEKVFPIYLGGDASDEPALAMVEGRGAGIVMAELPRATAAGYSLQRAEDVIDFLQRLARLTRGAK